VSAIRLMLRSLRRDERGATAIEYGLIVALLAVTCMGAFSLMGGQNGGMWGNIEGRVVPALSGPATPAS